MGGFHPDHAVKSEIALKPGNAGGAKGRREMEA
jgi:hypothetical protein